MKKKIAEALGSRSFFVVRIMAISLSARRWRDAALELDDMAEYQLALTANQIGRELDKAAKGLTEVLHHLDEAAKLFDKEEKQFEEIKNNQSL